MPAAAGSRSGILTVPGYLAAVRTVHGLSVREMASGLGVSASVVRRWLRGSLVPTWPRVQAMVRRWGGDPEILGLGAAVQRHCRATGMSVEDAVRAIRSGTRTAPVARPRAIRDRRQLSLPIGG